LHAIAHLVKDFDAFGIYINAYGIVVCLGYLSEEQFRGPTYTLARRALDRS
jgi:hypothetical protein